VTDDRLTRIYAAMRRSDWQHAREVCAEALTVDPSHADVHHALGLICCGEGVHADALPHFARARALDMHSARVARDAGLVYAKLGHWRMALDAWRPIVASLDGEALTLCLVAAVETDCAAEVLDRLPERPGSLPETSTFLKAYAAALTAATRFPEAETALLRGLGMGETSVLHAALADLYERTGRGEAGLDHRVACVRLSPQSATARLQLALAYADRGMRTESRAARIDAERLGLTRAEDRSASLLMSLAEPEETAASIRSASQAAFAGRATVPFVHARALGDRHPRRLRIGYISGEFRATPSYCFCRPFLEAHDRSALEVFLYGCSRRRDDTTRAYARWAEHWRDVAELTDDQLIAQLRADSLDVLVDLSGHLSDNRLQPLCERVAPVHATYPNYSATTGCPGIDYLFTDRWASPPGCEHEYSERLYRLASGHLVFHPPDDAPAVRGSSAELTRRPTFGMFQRLSKLNAGVWDAVAAVLAAVPESTLFIQCGERALDCAESSTSRRLRSCLADRGIDPGRLTLRGPRPYREHLEAVGAVDIALDTFPYGGQTTTCHALWMGVPVVTLRSDSHVGRLSGALLARANHPEWVATSPDGYVATAVALALDIPRLRWVRRQLRQEVVEAGLTDGVALARALEQAYAELSAASSPGAS
jgi:protein O-GlcNAc transferase